MGDEGGEGGGGGGLDGSSNTGIHCCPCGPFETPYDCNLIYFTELKKMEFSWEIIGIGWQEELGQVAIVSAWT